MIRFVMISDVMGWIPNPMITAVALTTEKPKEEPGVLYLVHGAEVAVSMYPDFDFKSNRINENTYWFDNEAELNTIIKQELDRDHGVPKVSFSLDELPLEGSQAFWYSTDRVYYVLIGDLEYLLDERISNRINVTSYNMGDEIGARSAKSVTGRDLRVAMKEHGMLDEKYNEQEFLSYLDSIGHSSYLLHIYKWLDSNIREPVYDFDDPAVNPYENILYVEEYLGALEISNIDLAKCEAYDLEIIELPARFAYQGFYTTTGRIFPSGNSLPLMNLAKSKRDILFAEPGRVLVEIDYKSFEFDILCQVIDLPVEDDPHSATYERLVGVPVDDPRTIGKKINYSYIYGMKPERVADMVLNLVPALDRDFKQEFIDKLSDEDMVLAVADLEDRINKSIRHGMFKNHFGRFIQFKKQHAIINNYIQSTASDFFYNKFVLISKHIASYDPSNVILLQNHDSMLLYLTEASVESTDMFERTLDIARSPDGGIAGRVDYKYGSNWKDLV